jgi:hypothetical protein
VKLASLVVSRHSFPGVHFLPFISWRSFPFPGVHQQESARLHYDGMLANSWGKNQPWLRPKLTA